MMTKRQYQLGIHEVRRIVLDSIGADFIVFDRAVPDMFHFKHNTGASNVMIFIGNPNVNSLSVVNNAFPVLT